VDWPVETTRTVTCERGSSIPWAVAPNVPLPRMTVPMMVALPGPVGEEEEDSWQEAARRSAAIAHETSKTVREIGKRVSMGVLP
jgi:hypothetical protein